MGQMGTCSKGELNYVKSFILFGQSLLKYSILEPNFTLGHEMTGEVVEIGRDVETLKVGDLVAVPATSKSTFFI